MSKILPAGQAEILTAEKHDLYSRALEAKSQGEADRLSKKVADIQRQLDDDLNERRRTGWDEARAKAASIACGTTTATENVSQSFRDLAAGRIDHLEFASPSEIRTDVTTGTSAGAYGGYTTVPGTFSQQVWVHRVETTKWLPYCTRIVTATGDTLRIPTTVTDPTAVAIAEGGAVTETNPVFGTLELGAFKYGMTISVTNELMQDTALDLTGLLARLTGRAIGRAVGLQLIQGDGTTEPGGLELNAAKGCDFADTDVPTLDELKELYYSVDSESRGRGTWLVSDEVLEAISYFKDDAGRYLLQDQIRLGEPTTFLGRPLLSDPFVQAGTATLGVFFGDLSAYYYREAGPLRFESSRDAGWDTDTTVFRALLRCDGGLADANAVKHGLFA